MAFFISQYHNVIFLEILYSISTFSYQDTLNSKLGFLMKGYKNKTKSIFFIKTKKIGQSLLIIQCLHYRTIFIIEYVHYILYF